MHERTHITERRKAKKTAITGRHTHMTNRQPDNKTNKQSTQTCTHKQVGATLQKLKWKLIHVASKLNAQKARFRSYKTELKAKTDAAGAEEKQREAEARDKTNLHEILSEMREPASLQDRRSRVLP